MLSVEQAQHQVLSAACPLSAVHRPLSESLGQVLAEDVASDIDMPPFDKSLVDGLAVRAADLPEGKGEVTIVGEIVAGMPLWDVDRAIIAGQAVRIMTGAAIPPGADAVVMVERTSQHGDESTRPLATSDWGHAVSGSATNLPSARILHQGVSVNDPQLKSGQNIMRRGSELASGQCVLRAGARLRPAEIGVLAAVGHATVSVHPRVRVAIICTGNELVESNECPSSGQIRNSNGPVLFALVTRIGATAQYLGIARDTMEDLERLVRNGLEFDLLLLSGGVSAGDLDLVPGVLVRLGVREVFHKVNFKPGKPVWFGVAERETASVAHPHGGSTRVSSTNSALDAARSSLVFGLPGNPVSVMACFELFVTPAIRRMMGFTDPGPRLISAALAEDRSYRSDRPTYWPACLDHSDDRLLVRLVPWKGSPDLRATTEANCFAIFPAGEHHFRRGERIQVLSTEY
jgi:molybdopterin molybdotransferase